MAESTIKYPVHYPVGCTICTSTNTNPSSIYGGTWSLVMKEFKHQLLTSDSDDDTYFELNTTNSTSYSDLAIILSGQNIFIRINIVNKVALSDTAVVLGTFNYKNMGINISSDGVAQYIQGFGDNGICMTTLNSSRQLQVYDVVTRVSSGTIAAGANMKFCFHWMIPYNYMIDSFCDKFYWRRTA